MSPKNGEDLTNQTDTKLALAKVALTAGPEYNPTWTNGPQEGPREVLFTRE
jgi:hypothetical protein